MDEELVSDSLVYRYDPQASPDGLRGSEGTFTICSFWYVDALARSGRLDDARLTFEKMLTYSNHLGLYSEEIAPTGEQIGNFPQAFSHLSLISAAMNLDYQLDHGSGWVEPVLKHGRRCQLTPCSSGRGLAVRQQECDAPAPDYRDDQHDRERERERVTAGDGRRGNDRTGQRHTERGPEVRDAARQPRDVALIPLREGGLDHVHRRGQHYAHAGADEQQARDERPDA